VSEVRPKGLSFLELYGKGTVAADQIDDFIDAWHDSDDEEKRPLAEYLGMTDDEYSVWLASHQALPLLVGARRDGTPLVEAVRRHWADLHRAALPADETAIHVLSHWLDHHGR
jgi:hypothetical protein